MSRARVTSTPRSTFGCRGDDLNEFVAARRLACGGQTEWFRRVGAFESGFTLSVIHETSTDEADSTLPDATFQTKLRKIELDEERHRNEKNVEKQTRTESPPGKVEFVHTLDCVRAETCAVVADTRVVTFSLFQHSSNP